MTTLWNEYGRNNQGVPQGAIEAILSKLGGERLAQLVHLALETTQDLPLDAALQAFGLSLQWDYAPEFKNQPDPVALGVRVSGTDLIRIDGVNIDSCAQKAGLSAMDTLIAIDQCKVSHKNLNAVLARKRPSDKIQVHVFREERLLSFDVTLDGAPKSTASLVTLDNALAEQLDLRRAWLGC